MSRRLLIFGSRPADKSPAGRARVDPRSVRGRRVPRHQSRDPLLRFAAVFAALAVGSEVLHYAVVVEISAYAVYLGILARISATILNILFHDVSVNGVTIIGSAFSMKIGYECDAIKVCALLTAAILAFPAPVRSRIRGVVAGVLLLQSLNVLRILSLFLVGAYSSQVFETVHEVVWPSFLIVFTVAIWILWVRQVSGDAWQPLRHTA